MNDYKGTLWVFLIAFILNLIYPIIGTLFIGIMVIVCYVNMRKAAKGYKSNCETCRLYDEETYLCLFTFDGVCKENCRYYRKK